MNYNRGRNSKDMCSKPCGGGNLSDGTLTWRGQSHHRLALHIFTPLNDERQ